MTKFLRKARFSDCNVRVMAFAIIGLIQSFMPIAYAEADMTITVEKYSDSAYQAHLSSNEFGDKVGKVLKIGDYKVHDLRITLQVNPADTRGQYRLFWRCGVRSVQAGEKPDRYFDNRGAMMPGKTTAEAKKAAEAKIAETKRVESARQAFVKTYGNVNVPAKGGLQTVCSTDGGKKGLSKNKEVWCLQNVVLIATD
jgi:hypothetical protein